MRPTLLVNAHGTWLATDIGLASYVSLFNSPYPAHVAGTAIDLYFDSDEALFPFEEGVVMEVKWFEVPKLRADAIDREPLILVKLGPTLIAKIMHVKPGVSVGEVLRYGDCLGKLVVSGYMYPWSEKHMHVELRPVHDRYRARGAYRIKLLNPIYVPSTSSVEGVIEHVDKHFVLLRIKRIEGYGPTPLHIDLGSLGIYFVEGGYPHYGYVALLGRKVETLESRDIGFCYANISKAMDRSMGIEVEGIARFDGIATYLCRKHLKLVSRSIIEGIKEGDEVSLGNPLKFMITNLLERPSYGRPQRADVQSR